MASLQTHDLGRPLVNHWGVRQFAPPGVWQCHKSLEKTVAWTRGEELDFWACVVVELISIT